MRPLTTTWRGEAQFRPQHLDRAREAYARGELLLAGALADPVDRALLVFRAAGSERGRELCAPRSLRDAGPGAALGSAAVDGRDRQ